MPRLFHTRTGAIGRAPGTIEYQGPHRTDSMVLRAFEYSADSCQERDLDGVSDALSLRDTRHLAWVNVDGVHDTQSLRTISDHFGLHPLVQEDIVNTHQRPKLEDYEGRIRTAGPAYLAYALLDAVVDSYFVILEQVGEQIERLEERLLQAAGGGILAEIHGLKREMILLRRAVWPLREVVAGLERGDSPLVHKSTRVFYRDLYDHTIQVADAVETYRDILTGLQDLYLSSVSNRMNEVIKVLTIIGTLFIPLTFLVGIYGMNFEYMPELGWKWSYPLFGLACLGIVGGMLTWLKRRGWL